MDMNMDVIELIWRASWPVQLVILLLLAASVASWRIIILKRDLIRKTKDASDNFEASFWSGGDLNALYRKVSMQSNNHHGMSNIFEAGFKEFNRVTDAGEVSDERVVDECRRAMRVAHIREVDRLEQGLAMLATIGSTSPYVGLFGTVWGIMGAFMSIGNMQSVTLATVAGPIAEALIATAMGLFAAIPAVIAYNRYVDKVVRLEVRYDGFTEEFLSILQRSASSSGDRT